MYVNHHEPNSFLTFTDFSYEVSMGTGKFDLLKIFFYEDVST